MFLGEYLKQKNLRKDKFAIDCGISYVTLENLLKGATPLGTVARKIEIATNGQVMLKDLIDFSEKKIKKSKSNKKG